MKAQPWDHSQRTQDRVDETELREMERDVREGGAEAALRHFARLARALRAERGYHHTDLGNKCPTLGTHVTRVLEYAGVYGDEELASYTPAQLLALREFGKVALAEVVNYLAHRGLSLAKEPRP